MDQTTTTTTELLTWLAGPGTGIVASLLFDQMRAWFPRPTRQQWHRVWPLQRLLWTALHAPAYAQWTAPGLAACIGIVATTTLTALQGGDVLQTLDIAIAGLVAGAFSLLTHESRKRSPRIDMQGDEP
jgi:hypothetical protein